MNYAKKYKLNCKEDMEHTELVEIVSKHFDEELFVNEDGVITAFLDFVRNV